MKIETREQLDEILGMMKRALDKADEESLGFVIRMEDVLEKNGYANVVKRSQAARAKIAASKQRELPMKVQAVAKPAPLAPPAAPRIQGEAIGPGYYTVEDDKGHVTFRVEAPRRMKDLEEGTLIISRLTGPDNTKDYTGVAFLTPKGRVNVWQKSRNDARLIAALEVLVRDPKAAGKAYALESKNCYRCNRPLTTPESIESGLGPICAGKE